MRTGIILVSIGVVGYIINVILIHHFIGRKAPEIYNVESKLHDGSYLWEQTSGTGIVPKWVSLIGLLAMALFIIGVLIILISLIVKLL